MEIYKGEIYDLLDSVHINQRRKAVHSHQKDSIQIREVNGEIVVMGLTEEKVNSFEEMM